MPEATYATSEGAFYDADYETRQTNPEAKYPELVFKPDLAKNRGTTRGNILQRVDSEGKFLGQPLLVLGATVEGKASDPDFIKRIHAVKLDVGDGKIGYDPDETVIINPDEMVINLGRLSYILPGLQKFFGK